MNLLFFGSADRQLFGAYHAPPAAVPTRGAAVLCAPWGPEYLVSHRILRRLAERLSDSGHHVLRFDYFGTGDSAGERQDGDLASWCADAAVAVDEIRDISGCAAVAVIGVRLGAVVGWRLALTRPDVHTTMLWDPVIDGAGYVRELVADQADSDRWSLTARRPSASPDLAVTLLGFPLTRAMRQSIEMVGPAEFSRPTRAHVQLFYSNVPTGQEALHATLRAAGTPFHAETVPGQTRWRDEAIGAGGVPLVALERMVAGLS